MTIVRRTTTKLDGMYLVLNLLEYADKSCRAEVVYQPSERPMGATIVMIHQQSSVALAVAAIARDFSTFATRTLTSLPTIGQLVVDYEDENEDDV